MRKNLIVFLTTYFLKISIINAAKNNCIKNDTCMNQWKKDFGCFPTTDWNLILNEGKIVRNVCLPNDYNVVEPPNDLTQVSNIFADSRLLDVDERKNEITMKLFMISLWEDWRIKVLLANESNAIPLPPITVTKQEIWHPFLFLLIQDMKEILHIFHPLVIQNIMVGSGEWANILLSSERRKIFPLDSYLIAGMLNMKVKFSCNFDFTYYPFDHQTCSLRIITNGINSTLYERPKHNLSFTPMLQPEFNGFYLDRTLVNNPPESNPMTRKTTSTFGIDLEMKRQTGMYFYQYFIPVMAIVTISFFSFIIPLSTLPARVAIVVTQFLTLTNIFIHEMVSSYSYSS